MTAYLSVLSSITVVKRILFTVSTAVLYLKHGSVCVKYICLSLYVWWRAVQQEGSLSVTKSSWFRRPARLALAWPRRSTKSSSSARSVSSLTSVPSACRASTRSVRTVLRVTWRLRPPTRSTQTTGSSLVLCVARGPNWQPAASRDCPTTSL